MRNAAIVTLAQLLESTMEDGLMILRNRGVLATVLVASWMVSTFVENAAAEGLFEITKILGSDPQESDFLGGEIISEGDWLFVDRRYDDEAAPNAGAVLVFLRDGVQWTEVQQLRPSITGSNDFFGGPMAVDGNTLMVGSRARDDTVGGTVFVFEYDGTSWVETQILTPSVEQSLAYFGQGGAFALEGDTAIIGAYRENVDGSANAGAVYVFEYVGSQWIETQRITRESPVANDNFGINVQMEEDVAMIQSRTGVGTNSGLIHVYRDNGVAWIGEQVLEAGDPATNEFFGNDFVFAGNTLIASAVGDDNNKGAVYVFYYDGTQWSEQSKYVPSEIVESDQYGGTLALDGDRVLVAARNRSVDSMDDVGVVYCYRLSENTLVDEESFTVSDPESGLFFPASIAFDGDIVYMGAQRDDHDGIVDQGSVYVFGAFDCEPGTVNAGNDTILNVLFVEGTAGGADRTVEIGDGEFVDVTVVEPAGGGNGRFAIHANLGDTTTVSVPQLLPFGIGSTCFPFLLSEGAAPVIVASSLGKAALLGESAFFGNSRPDPDLATTSFSYPPLPFGMVLTFQGIIVDPSSAGSKAVSVTNSVIVRVE